MEAPEICAWTGGTPGFAEVRDKASPHVVGETADMPTRLIKWRGTATTPENIAPRREGDVYFESS